MWQDWSYKKGLYFKQVEADFSEGENTAKQFKSLNNQENEILSDIFTSNVSTGVEIEINGRVSECLVDTGAFSSFISFIGRKS